MEGNSLQNAEEAKKQVNSNEENSTTKKIKRAKAPKKPKPQYERVPLRDLPSKAFVGVEYPAHVVNIDKALETIGGIETLTKIHNSANPTLELRFHPNDSFSHPVFGDKVSSKSLLLKVTKYKRRKLDKNNETPRFQTEVIGSIPTIYKFQGMADFQFLTSNTQTRYSLESFTNLDEWPDKEELPSRLEMPPPIFSRVDIPQNYRYKPNPAFKIINDEEGPKIITKSVYIRTGILEVAYSEPVPTQPSEFATAKELSPEFKILENKVHELFEKRPVWTRVALAAQLNIAVQPLNRILPRVAFYYRSGPWRKTWVKLGFDPKIHPEAKIYQVVDLRVSQKDIVKKKNSKLYHALPVNTKPRRYTKTGEILEEALKRPPVIEKPDKQEITFTAPPSHMQSTYQICDLRDKDIQTVVLSAQENQCDEKAGWLPKKTVNQIVTMMKKKIPKLKEKKGENEADLNLEIELPTFSTVQRSEGGNEEQGNIFPAYQELAEIQPYNIFGEDDEDFSNQIEEMERDAEFNAEETEEPEQEIELDAEGEEFEDEEDDIEDE